MGWGCSELKKKALQETGNLGWVVIHWFELATLILLFLNLWFVSSVLHALKETNRWLAFLTPLRWDERHEPESPTEQ
jgi:hypothetical protein